VVGIVLTFQIGGRDADDEPHTAPRWVQFERTPTDVKSRFVWSNVKRMSGEQIAKAGKLRITTPNHNSEPHLRPRGSLVRRNLPIANENHAMRMLRDVVLVRHDNDRVSLRVQILKQGHDLIAGF
jgi:hypothetical protein